MDSNLKPYEEYKETEYDWLGSVPRHWKEQTVRSITKLSSERNGNRNDLELLSVYREYGVIRKSSRDDNHNVESQDLSNYKFVDSGYLVLNKMKMWQGSLGVSRYRGIVSPAYIVCKLIGDLNHEYIHYLMRSAKFKTIYNRISYGVRVGQWDMRYDDFKNIKLYLPPIAEQNQIVKFLDNYLSKINKFINAKKKLIEVLKEKKHAVINEAVTKGLNQNVKLKPSGIDWLGNIPEHWDVKPLRQLLRPVSIKNRPDLPLLSVVREKGVILRSSMSKEENHNFIPDDLSGYKVVKNGQFAMNKMKAWQGSYGVSPYHGIVSPAYYIFDLNFENKDYFHYAIRSRVYVNFFYQASDGIRVGQWDLSLDKMKEIPFFVPPEEEQKEILEYIPKEFKRIEDTVERLKKEIDLIEEYRVRLISDVVTGKVDVSNIEMDDFQNEELEAVTDEDIFELEEVLEGEECEV